MHSPAWVTSQNQQLFVVKAQGGINDCPFRALDLSELQGILLVFVFLGPTTIEARAA